MAPPHEPWLIARLFDFSFTRFVSLAVVRIVYFLLAVVGLVPLAYGVFILFELSQNFPEALLPAVLLLVAAPLIYFVYLLLLRVICETLIVLFSIAEHLAEIREALQRPPAALQSPPTSEQSQ
jgi:hypothetical protein